MSRALLLVPALLLLTGCDSGSDRPGFALGMSLFGADTKTLPSTLVMIRPPSEAGQPWTKEVVSETSKEEGGMVFHKCMWFEPVSGAPGILTCSADPAFLKIWRRSGNGWEAETIWEGAVGGSWEGARHRLRDMEVADVNGDGSDDICIVTHDQGKIMVIEQLNGGYEATVIDEPADPDEHVFVHEMEVGDVDGDGIVEMFTTPSAPNKLDGSEQPGAIVMYDWNGESYDRIVVEEFAARHVKEVLCCDYDGSGRPWLFASIEGENIQMGGGGGADDGASTMIRVYKWGDGGMTSADVSPLPGKLCRFLNCGDTDGDGTNEIVASTKSNGIHALTLTDGEWTRKTVAMSSKSGGFEHATYLLDWDGDGRDEIFVASDNQKLFQMFSYDETTSGYRREELASLKDIAPKGLFTWNIMPLPAGE